MNDLRMFNARWETWVLGDFSPESWQKESPAIKAMLGHRALPYLRHTPEFCLIGNGSEALQGGGNGKFCSEKNCPSSMDLCHVVLVLDSAPAELVAIAQAQANIARIPLLPLRREFAEADANRWVELFFRPEIWFANHNP